MGKQWNGNNHSVKHLNRMARGSQPGNYYIIREEIEAMWGNTFSKRSGLTSQFDQETKDELIFYEKDYWRWFFTFWDNNTNRPHQGLEFAKPYIIDCLYENSGIGIVMVGDQALVYRLAMFWRNAFQQITRASGIIYAYPTDYDASLPNYSLMNRFDLTNQNCAMILSDPYARPWGYGIIPWATRRKDSYAARDINLISSLKKKLIISPNVSNNKLKEIRQIQSSGNPWEVVSDNDITSIQDMSLPNEASNIWLDYSQLMKDFHRMRGIRFNLDAKGERNVSGEVGNNDAIFITSEGKKIDILTQLCEKINELWGWQGINVSVKSRLDIFDINQQEINSIPLMNREMVRGEYELQKELARESDEEE